MHSGAMDFHGSNNVEADITFSDAAGSNSDIVPSVQSCSYATLGNGVNLSSSGNSSALGVPLMAGPFSGSTGSDRKRTRRVAAADDETFEDILGQITAKLTTLNTTEDPRMVEEDNNIVAFIEVLKCSREEATFYLESSAWNIETAILLWIENNPSPSYQTYNPWGSDPTAAAASSYSHYYNHALLNTASSAFSQSTLATPASKPPRQWYSREVIIQDFPQDWSARVSRSSGQIYFVHLPTGRRQYSVPPGYADIPVDMSTNDCDDLCDTKTEVLIDDDYPTKLSPDEEGPLGHDDQTSLSSLLTHRFKGDYNMLTTAESLPGAATAVDPSMLIDNNSSNNQNYFTKNDKALEGEDMTIDYASRSNASSTRALHDENSVYTITNDVDDRPVSDVMYNNSDLSSSSSSYRHGKGSYIAGEASDGSMESGLDAYFAASGSNSSSISNK